jgi:hypothetical protein
MSEPVEYVDNTSSSKRVIHKLWMLLGCAACAWLLFKCYRLDAETVRQSRLLFALKRAAGNRIEIDGLPTAIAGATRLDRSSSVARSQSASARGLVFVSSPGCPGCQEAQSQWALISNDPQSHIDRIVVVTLGTKPEEQGPAELLRYLPNDSQWETRTVVDVGAFQARTGILAVPSTFVFDQMQRTLIAANGVLTADDMQKVSDLLHRSDPVISGAEQFFGQKALQLSGSVSATSVR